MQLEIPKPELSALVVKQVDNLFCLRHEEERDILDAAVEAALQSSQYCFSQTNNKYYHRKGETYFNPFHSGQYCIFLYFLSRAIFMRRPDASTLADRIYYLNKALNGADLFYEVEMPDVFFLDHPVGSVMGRAPTGTSSRLARTAPWGTTRGSIQRSDRTCR